MKTFEDYKSMISILTGDENQKRYSEDMIRTGLQFALKDYDRFLPKKMEQTVPIMPINRFQFFVPLIIEPERLIFGIRTGNTECSSVQRFRSVNSYRCQRTNSGCLITIMDSDFDIVSGGKALLELSEAHTIAHLNNASITSVPDGHMEIICRGGSGYAMQMRAASITEVFGRGAEDYETLIRQSAVLIQRFLQDLEALSITMSEYNHALPTAGFSADR